MSYKIFDASFYKYTIFIEWDAKMYHFPSIVFSVHINREYPAIHFQLNCCHYSVSIWYSQGYVEEYEIITNDFKEQ